MLERTVQAVPAFRGLGSSVCVAVGTTGNDHSAISPVKGHVALEYIVAKQ